MSFTVAKSTPCCRGSLFLRVPVCAICNPAHICCTGKALLQTAYWARLSTLNRLAEPNTITGVVKSKLFLTYSTVQFIRVPTLLNRQLLKKCILFQFWSPISSPSFKFSRTISPTPNSARGFTFDCVRTAHFPCISLS